MGEINGSVGTIYYFVFTSVMTFIVIEQEQEQEEKPENIQLFIEKVFCKQGLKIQDNLDINEKIIARRANTKKKLIGSTKQYKDNISSNDLMQMQQTLICVRKSIKCFLKEIEN